MHTMHNLESDNDMIWSYDIIIYVIFVGILWLQKGDRGTKLINACIVIPKVVY